MQITSSGDRNDILPCPPLFGPERDLVDIIELIMSQKSSGEAEDTFGILEKWTNKWISMAQMQHIMGV